MHFMNRYDNGAWNVMSSHETHESLRVGDCRLTDAGLAKLSELHQLKILMLGDDIVEEFRNQLTAEGVAKLQAALPQCKIECHPEPAK